MCRTGSWELARASSSQALPSWVLTTLNASVIKDPLLFLGGKKKKTKQQNHLDVLIIK